MRPVYPSLLSAMWLLWVLYWVIAAANAKRALRRESAGSRLSHVLPLALAAILLVVRRTGVAVLDASLLPFPIPAYWVGVAITAAGLLFTVWARVHLGGNWSGEVTIKQGHELISTGPYAIVRHPIYTGLIFAFAGTALARNDLRGVLALVIAAAALWRKLLIEERWLAQKFGAAYQDYRRRVRALIPFVL